MIRPQGYLVGVGDDIIERDTITCKHCQRVVVVPPMSSGKPVKYDYCRNCDGWICQQCAGERRCLPWEKQMEAIEARYHALRSYGLI